MYYLASIVAAVVADVIAHYVCKLLDSATQSKEGFPSKRSEGIKPPTNISHP